MYSYSLQGLVISKCLHFFFNLLLYSLLRLWQCTLCIFKDFVKLKFILLKSLLAISMLLTLSCQTFQYQRFTMYQWARKYIKYDDYTVGNKTVLMFASLVRIWLFYKENTKNSALKQICCFQILNLWLTLKIEVIWYCTLCN